MEGAPAQRSLIGFTGFVGSNLRRQARFEHLYNSRNFAEMRDTRQALIVCAGVSAAKWIANRDPDADRRRIEELTDVLATTEVDEFILISTIDVYPDPAAGGDETTPVKAEAATPYGRHRYALEQWAARTFANCRIIRLPAVFGPGLKKNALFDLLHDNQVGAIDPGAMYQWYPVSRLWADIEIARQANLRIVNLCPEPLRTERIIAAYFPAAAVGPLRETSPAYRMSTRHADLFGGSGGFILTEDACLDLIGAFVATEKAAD